MVSNNYKAWYSVKDLRRCGECEEMHGKIYTLKEKPVPSPPLHTRCRCTIERLQAIAAGTATKQGIRGADIWLKNWNKLPEYYISVDSAKKLGWKSKIGNLNQVAPGKMLAKGVYRNRNGHLPSAPGRTWYEADINYTLGYRSTSRILYSSDGLIFVTYDHYKTFVEVI